MGCETGKKPPLGGGGVWIFSGTTQYSLNSFSSQPETNHKLDGLATSIL